MFSGYFGDKELEAHQFLFSSCTLRFDCPHLNAFSGIWKYQNPKPALYQCFHPSGTRTESGKADRGTR